MRKRRIGIIDLVLKGPTHALYARIMNANLASIMPQVIAVWCEQEGHDVTFVCYTGFENLVEELPDKVDLVFIGAFTEAAQLAYALSHLFRSHGAVTVLGGPHARCYPQDAVQYFDYVLGFTDKAVIRDVLQDCAAHRPNGLHLAARQQPAMLPGVRERWKFIAPTLQKAPLIKIVPMLGSLGCPYTCSFCIDASVPYQSLDFEVMQEDLGFLVRTLKRPRVAWHDPNFGVRFNDSMDAIEEAVPPGRIEFIVESSLSLLSEPHLKRLKRNGFKALLPGIESRWMHVVRAVSSEGFGRIQYHTDVRRRLDTDAQFRRYFEQEITELPQFYVDLVRKDLGALWEWLPEGAMYHAPNAYLKSEMAMQDRILRSETSDLRH